MRHRCAIVLLALAASAVQAGPRENTVFGYAQVLSVEPVYVRDVVETQDPACLRPGREPEAPLPAACRPRSLAVRRVVAYDVTYTYKGDTFMSRLDFDPGNRLRVRVSVVPDDHRVANPVAPPERR
jgi:uncharacterized protein YcfJ